MRKVIWCCLAAGMLAAGSFLSLAFYACRCPESVVGRSMQVIAEASVAMQPLNGLTSMAARTNQANETAPRLDECVPDDPQPVALERKKDEFLTQMHEVELDAAPIVIHEDEAPPLETIVLNERNFETADMQGQEIPPKACPTVMPYCRDEDEPATPPKMPRADAGAEMEHSVFKAWVELFAEGNKEKTPEVEELPPPKEEEPQEEPKCEEDRHLHEQYPGCPRTTCPYTRKERSEKYYQRFWGELESQLKQKGSEESSEEPPHSGKDRKGKEQCPRTKGVDTMEYRKSDAGLDEYGPGQVH